MKENVLPMSMPIVLPRSVLRAERGTFSPRTPLLSPALSSRRGKRGRRRRAPFFHFRSFEFLSQPRARLDGFSLANRAAHFVQAGFEQFVRVERRLAGEQD